jgi:hypothetical protein
MRRFRAVTAREIYRTLQDKSGRLSMSAACYYYSRVSTQTIPPINGFIRRTSPRGTHPVYALGLVLVCFLKRILLNRARSTVSWNSHLIIGVTVKKTILQGFDKAVSDLKRVLDEGVLLEEQDKLFIENRLLLLQVAYAEWKGRNHNTGLLP